MKKYRPKWGNETYGTKDIFQAFQEAFSPFFSPDESNQRVGSKYDSVMREYTDQKKVTRDSE
ncbi:hypothetical protein J2Z48_001331 [Croceifilum oryzae]|uniref:Uncharacterized protein n=1 Tax=Croceifilum oryzae TaxID=1553429 RepID=A0AAJ1TEX7_9BACL|nr:hypothetical protein [Croceifilum oryzae]MDQ0417159.1 hypothetical protein [Croceifilum oryzae]